MKSFVSCLLILGSIGLYSQDLPKWYTDLLDRKAGEWLADNSAFRSELEPNDFYRLQWWKGANGSDLHGVLKGNGEKAIWSYYQYYDKKEGKAILLQMGMNGLKGRGEISWQNDSLLLIEQNFEDLNGEKWNEVHHEIRMIDGKAKTINYSVEKNEELKKGRTYIWEKQQHIKL